MAQRKTTPPSKKAERSDKVGIQFYADQDTADALTAYIASIPEDLRPKRRGVILTAIRDYLASKGHWPPKSEK